MNAVGFVERREKKNRRRKLTEFSAEVQNKKKRGPVLTEKLWLFYILSIIYF